jgi:toxin HigB-1
LTYTSNRRSLVVVEIVELSKIEKQLKKIPHFIVGKLRRWKKHVETVGLKNTKKIPGYHDEPLKGDRAGERSIRLSKGWRAIYTEEKTGQINIIIVEEITKHGY